MVELPQIRTLILYLIMLQKILLSPLCCTNLERKIKIIGLKEHSNSDDKINNSDWLTINIVLSLEYIISIFVTKIYYDSYEIRFWL